jgi:tRNA-binding protein
VDKIDYQDFHKVDIRVGRIVDAQDFPKARKPAYKVWVDFGELGIKKSSAQLTVRYSKEDLIGQLVIAVVNFPPKQIADFQSEILIVGVPGANADDVVLVRPDFEVLLGGKLF